MKVGSKNRSSKVGRFKVGQKKEKQFGTRNYEAKSKPTNSYRSK